MVEDLVTRVDEVQDLKMRVIILEKAVACGVEMRKEHTSKVRVPEPQHFKRTRDKKKIDNFFDTWSTISKRCDWRTKRIRSNRSHVPLR